MYNVSREQALCLFQAYLGRNMLITGPAGTGKSFIMKMIVEMLKGGGRRAVRTASTGTAAINIGGSTIHSFTGIGINDNIRPGTLTRWRQQKNYVWENFETLDTLMIDEISMLNEKQFDLVEAVARFMLDNHKKAAGGLQVIVCGDFLQLPPVSGSFAFKSDAWKRLNFGICQLETSFRQTDPTWFNMLCKLRKGQRDAYTVDRLFSRVLGRMTTPPENTDCTQLFSKRAVVQKVNEERLAQLPPPYVERDYTAVTKVYKIHKMPLSTQTMTEHIHTYVGNSEPAIMLDKHFKVNHSILLKTGCKVMLIENGVAPNTANGSVGVVTSIAMDSVEVLFEGHEKPVKISPVTWEYTNQGKHEAYSRRQLPLILAYAITIHKAQGMGLERAKTSLRENEIFQAGQAYVALSRVHTLEGLLLEAFSPNTVRAHPECLKFYQQLDEERRQQAEYTPKYKFNLS
jgi:hypothetical protein